MAGNISVGARREVVSAVAERYRSAGRGEKGRILDELTAVTGWHRKHAVRALRAEPPTRAAETKDERLVHGALARPVPVLEAARDGNERARSPGYAAQKTRAGVRKRPGRNVRARQPSN
jgi:hypothetical protein